MRRLPRIRPLTASAVAALVVAMVGVAGCGSTSPPAGRLAVVAAENVWGDIAAQVGGSHVTVTSILSDPNADPHTFETDPRSAAAITTAALVIENGAGYDDFIDKLLSASGSSVPNVLTIATAVGAGGNNPNPHFWYSPDLVATAARAIASHLASADPSDSTQFAANLEVFLTAYQPYAATLDAIRARHAGAPIAYTERVPGYLVQRAGLHLATPASFAQSIEDGNDPSPADAEAMDTAMTGKQVRLLLYNSQVSSPATERVKQLAVAAGIPVIGVSETIPAGAATFQAWQIAQARAILAALGG